MSEDLVRFIRFLHNISNNNYNDDDDYDDDEAFDNEFVLKKDEANSIKSSFETNRERKTPKPVAKQKPRELTQDQIIRMSMEEERQTNLIREYISNKGLLVEVLSELKGVDPNDPIFNEFYN